MKVDEMLPSRSKEKVSFFSKLNNKLKHSQVCEISNIQLGKDARFQLASYSLDLSSEDGRKNLLANRKCGTQ